MRTRQVCPLRGNTALPQVAGEAFDLLRIRDDEAALAMFGKVLDIDPQDADALWAKAEVFRRRRQWSESEAILQRVLKKHPGHVPSMISLAYIRYHDDRLQEALDLIDKAMADPCLSRENKALCFMMLGTINSRRSQQGGFLNKIKYGAKIKNYFLMARKVAPELPEVHLGLGSFYLKAPVIAGGNINKAIQELELAVKLAPGFATAHARLSQAYKKKGDLAKCQFCLRRAQDLDPGNEALLE